MPTGISRTVDSILDLAPDMKSAAAGRSLAVPAQWAELYTASQLDSSEVPLFWGLCKGSGKTPYQVVFDWGGLGYHCSCPSRKFPCKHVLGIMLLAVENKNVFSAAQLPTWVNDWHVGTLEKAKKSAEQTARAIKPSDEDFGARMADKARRTLQREKRAEDGIAALEVWIKDLVTQGFATLRGKPGSFWEGPATRMVDAQLPGLARRIRDLGAVVASKSDWQNEVFRHLASLHLLVRGFQNLQLLPPQYQAEIRNQVGYSIRKEDLEDLPGLFGTWLVLASHSEIIFSGERDRSMQLISRRTWLLDVRTKQPGLLLEFSPAHLPFNTSYPNGARLEGEFVFYPGILPLRLHFRSMKIQEPVAEDKTMLDCLPMVDIQSAWTGYTEKFGVNPWIGSLPILLGQVVPIVQKTSGRMTGWIIDSPYKLMALPIDPGFEKFWELIALSGGKSVNLIGEWNGRYFWPLRAQSEDEWLTLA